MELSDNIQNIFIKRGPQIFDTSEAEESLQGIEENLEENPEMIKDPLMARIVAGISRLAKGKGLVDYSGCTDFWIADNSMQGEEINLVSPGEYKKEKKFANLQELENSYMDLNEFLGKAKYVGKYFYRTEPVEGDDRSYMPTDNPVLAKYDSKILTLFATEENMLVLKYDPLFNKQTYEMMSPRYLMDGNYAYYDGDVDNSYNDSAAIYQAVLDQIINEEKKKGL